LKTTLRIFLVVSFLLCSIFSQFAAGQVVYAENFEVNNDSSQIYGIPNWAVHGDKDLSWMKEEMLSNTELKSRTISILKRKIPIVSALDTVFEMSTEEIGQISFMRDINHDGKPDFILHGMLPFCNSRPYTLIALNRDSLFQEIFHHEGDFVSWQESDDTTRFQILVSGCCEDRHGYLYDYTSAEEDTLVFSVFWQYNSHHPNFIHPYKTGIVQHDSVILLPAPEPAESRKNHISYQFNWILLTGDEVQILSSHTEKDATWYYVKTTVSQRNNPDRFPQATYVYGWVFKTDVLE
jgi:hypothetical protein